MARDLPEDATQAFRCLDHIKRLSPMAWDEMCFALQPIMDLDIATHIMFGLPPWGNCLQFAAVMAWRFQTALPPLPMVSEGA